MGHRPVWPAARLGAEGVSVMRVTLPRRWACRAAAVICFVGVSAVWHQPAAGAAVAPPVTDPATGNATWFDALGEPYGGCGLPQQNLDSQHFIALNVYNTPKDYTYYPRPMPDGDPKTGIWDNGHNCGRWA